MRGHISYRERRWDMKYTKYRNRGTKQYKIYSTFWHIFSPQHAFREATFSQPSLPEKLSGMEIENGIKLWHTFCPKISKRGGCWNGPLIPSAQNEWTDINKFFHGKFCVYLFNSFFFFLVELIVSEILRKNWFSPTFNIFLTVGSTDQSGGYF